MVVFTCGHCGESVQKPKVEKHYLTKCRNRNPNLSCMDCFKDFLGQDYDAHTKCITEEERYSGKGFTPKEKKGEKKQNVWVEMVQSVLDEQKNAPRNVLKIVETISKHNNTPRKKPKFINFVKNVCGHKTNPKDIEQAWDLIAVKLSALSNNTNNKNQQDNKENLTNGEADDEGDKSNGGKVKNGIKEDITKNGDVSTENGDISHENGDADNSESKNGLDEPKESEKAVDKKLTKKQRKEEKKRQKYEAELNSAVAPVEEEDEETEAPTKKEKKKKNRTDSVNKDEDKVQSEGKNKHKKRKRQDTANSAAEVPVNAVEPEENVAVTTAKTQKKKLKLGEEELNESVCLHDQNVAKGEEIDEEGGTKSDKFNWHAVILSVLDKKGNEMPFKRLQKKVLSEYTEITGREVDDRIAEKFIKKVKSAPKVKVVKNTVLLEE